MGVKFYVSFKKLDRTLTNENGFLAKNGNGKANGSTVILIHGLTGSPNEMAFLAAQLSKNGFASICPRLANHGEPIEILKDSRWQDFYDTVRETFLKIEAENETNNIFVAGVCVGALLALNLGAEFQDRIAGISCLAPTLFHDGWNVPWYSCLLPIAYATPLKHFFYYKEDPPYGIKNETLRKRVHNYYEKANIHDLRDVSQYGYPYIPVTLIHQEDLLIRETKKKLPMIKSPVQIVQSKDDDAGSIKNSEYIYQHIGSKIKEMVILENSYHVISVDNDRQIVAQKMCQFFSRFLTQENTRETASVTSTV